MKRWIFAAAVLLAAAGAGAQELPKPGSGQPGKSSPESGFVLPDSLAHMTPWQPDFKAMEPIRIEPTVSMSSIVTVTPKRLPARIEVINNNTLRLGRHVNVSNGQAWNYGPYRNAFLDARTISLPMPR